MTKKIKVLIAESLDLEVLENFESAIEFTYQPDISVAELEEEIANYDGLIVRPKQVTTKAINNAKKLKLIIRGGAGVNSIDLEAAKENNVVVENTPALNSDATAEFTINLMCRLLAKRQIILSNQLTQEGNPGNPETYIGYELKGKKIGIIGLGNIGQRVAKISDAFGMDILCYARNKKDLPYKQTDNLDEFFAAGHDLITIHVPYNDQTKHILNEKAFEQMKQGTILINTARPQLIYSETLIKACKSGVIKSFAIDGDYDLIEPFRNIPNSLLTHHIADCTYEAQRNITAQALKQAAAFFENGEEINRVA